MEEKPRKRKKRKGERPDGLIQRSLKVGYKPDGSPDRKYFYGHTAKEAEDKRDAYRLKLLSGSKFSDDITVSEWLDVFLSTYRVDVNQAYLQSDDVPYNRLRARLGKMRVADVCENDLQQALNEVAGMSFSTVDKYRQAIKRVFKKALKNKIIRDDPAEELKMPSYTKGTHRALENWEVQLIVDNWNHPATHAGLWVMIMLLCGLRRSEMMALRWANVNLKARTLRVCEVAVIQHNKAVIEERAKTEAGERTLPLCQALYDALASVPEDQRDGFVCLSAKKLPLTESAASRGIKSFCTVMERLLNGVEPDQRGRRRDLEEKPEEGGVLWRDFSFTCHDLRHTYATALYDAGVPVKAAQYFLGHSDIRVTLDLYTHLSKERQEKSREQAIEYLDKWLDQRVVNALSLEQEEGEKGE